MSSKHNHAKHKNDEGSDASGYDNDGRGRGRGRGRDRGRGRAALPVAKALTGCIADTYLVSNTTPCGSSEHTINLCLTVDPGVST
jgi:hypothetical protein